MTEQAAPLDSKALAATRFGVPVKDAPGWDGAVAHYLDASGRTHSWLVDDPATGLTGYIKDAPGITGTVQVGNPHSWADITDSLDLVEFPTATQAQASENADADEESSEADQEKHEEAAGAAPVSEGKAAAVAGAAADAAEDRTEIILALMVPEGDAADIALDSDNAEPAADLHLTLAHLGSVDEVDDVGAFYSKVLDALRDTASENQPVTGSVNGVGRFTVNGGNDAFVYLFDSPGLAELRQDLVEDLEEEGIDVTEEHGFTPHITIAFLQQGEDNPIRRAEPKVLTFGELTFCFGDQRLPIKLGGVDPDEADGEFQADTTNGYIYTPDTTAPDALPGVKGALPPQFRKGGKKKGGPPFSTGSFVAWGSSKGRIDLVVTSGKVPGVEEDVTGSAASPAARVVVWSQGADGKWSATGKKVGVLMSSLKRTLPLNFAKGGTKALDPDEALVGVLTGYYEAAAETKDLPLADPVAVRTVYERGLQSWPGEDVGVEREPWALGRTKAFLTVAAGREVPGYVADRDLLPEGHQLAERGAPLVVVDDTGRPERVLTPEQTERLAAEQTESKVAVTLAEGEALDAKVVEDVLAGLRQALS